MPNIEIFLHYDMNRRFKNHNTYVYDDFMALYGSNDKVYNDSILKQKIIEKLPSLIFSISLTEEELFYLKLKYC